MEEGAYTVEVSDHIMIAHSFKGEVYFISPQLNTGTRTALVKSRIAVLLNGPMNELSSVNKHAIR